MSLKILGTDVFWSVKNSGEILQRLNFTNTTLPHDLIKQKLILLIQKSFNKSTYMACNTEKAFFYKRTSEEIHYVDMR